MQLVRFVKDAIKGMYHFFISIIYLKLSNIKIFNSDIFFKKSAYHMWKFCDADESLINIFSHDEQSDKLISDVKETRRSILKALSNM